MLRQFIRRFLPADPNAPSLVRSLFSSSYRRLHRVGRAVKQATGGQVVAGPFKGLKYGDRSIGSSYGPKLLGTYEKELEDVIGQSIARGYPLAIDIGAAEGYYAVGLATRLPPQSRVIAFEAQTRQHLVLRDLAARNGVSDRITLHGYGTTQLLSEALKSAVGNSAGNHEKTFVICDVEGFEEELLDPAAVPELQHADILVELHEFLRAGIGRKLQQRFASSHRITEIHARPRSLEDWPGDVKLEPGAPEDRLLAMNEGRPGQMSWLWMEALSS